ncbi:MAG TPA: hypothetical protein VEP48_01795 [Methylomirabilota bacterium]|nr:hypothetical protein [Methylomirabilota bacterium]
MTLVNMKQRYVASTLCPIGKLAQAECAALASRIFDDDASASAALVAHLASAECHNREQLANIVGAVRDYTHSYRLVYENHVWDGLAA